MDERDASDKEEEDVVMESADEREERDEDSDDEDNAGSDDEDEEEEEDQEEQIRVQFSTEHVKYRVTSTSIAVPLSLGRKGLSQIISHLLSLDDGAVSFDFCISEKDVLVRKKLEVHVSKLSLSRETVLQLEYAPAVPAPELGSEEALPDWTAAVDASRSVGDAALVVAGTFDGSVQLCQLSAGGALAQVSSLAAHSAPVKGVCQLPGSDLLATCSKDGSIKLFSLTARPADRKLKHMQVNAAQLAVCQGSGASVEAVAGAVVGSHAVLATGGWDHAVCLWKVPLDDDAGPENDDEEEAGEERSAKSRKLGKSGKKQGKAAAASESRTLDRPSVAMMEHTDKVSAVSWAGPDNVGTLFSCSWDHSVRCWDVARESCSVHLHGNKVATSLAYSAQQQLLATGHADHHVRLWDARAAGDAIVKTHLGGAGGHSKWVSAVQWSPSNPHLLVSASHDRSLRLWDIRSTAPLHVIPDAHSNKAFAVDWQASNPGCIVSGGADSKVRTHRVTL